MLAPRQMRAGPKDNLAGREGRNNDKALACMVIAQGRARKRPPPIALVADFFFL